MSPTESAGTDPTEPAATGEPAPPEPTEPVPPSHTPRGSTPPSHTPQSHSPQTQTPQSSTSLSSDPPTPAAPFVVRLYRRGRAEVAPYARAIGVVAVLAAVWAVWASGPGWLTPAYLVLAVVGAALGVIDAHTHRLPNALVYPLTWTTAVLLTVAALGTGDWWSLGRAALGGLAFFAVYQVLYLVAPAGGIGYGDVKLALSLGAVLTWHSWTTLLVGVFAAHILAGVVAIVLLIGRRAGWKTGIAFGPYMLLGTAVTLTWVRLTAG